MKLEPDKELWQAMMDACAPFSNPHHKIAAMIEAVANYVVPEEPELTSEGWPETEIYDQLYREEASAYQQRQDIRDQLIQQVKIAMQGK